MGNKPKVVRLPNDDRDARITIPALIWRVAKHVGEVYGRGTKDPELYGIWFLLKTISDKFEAGDASFLDSPEFVKGLRSVLDANYGAPVGGPNDIDISQLHKSTKLKSGFVGVYANGAGFRAMGRDLVGREKYIGNYQTAIEAAHRRRQYCIANNLPYGELEAEMERWRKDVGMHAQHYNDEQLIEQIRGYAHMTGLTEHIFGPNTTTIVPKYDSSEIEGSKPDLEPAPTTKVLGFEDGDIPEALR